ncbi:hypothetical protein B381_05966 [Stutzerimonas stutzeri NF13]|uniref:Uncharacterized protein n=1 Tax=Stutzerimonas stutzeri NF13 TaxID=1212548 RepID=M2TUM0_STUST|nr:hypothetical protein B381_05966 [Stutzerimonas stutzeri NF13]
MKLVPACSGRVAVACRFDGQSLCQVTLQASLFRLAEGQPEFGAAPEDVIHLGCPLFAPQVIDFLRVQLLAEILAQCIERARFAQHAPHSVAVESGPAPGQRQFQPLYLGYQLFGECVGRAHAFAARQCRLCRPAFTHAREERLELRHRRLGELAVGGELAAEHRKQRCLFFFRRQRQGVITGNRGGVIRFVVAQRPDAGEGMHDVPGLELLAKVRVGHAQYVGDLLLADAHLGRVATVLSVGGADHGVAIQVGDGEDDAPILVLHDVGLLAVIQLGHDDVAALNQADAVWRALLQVFTDELCDPGTGGVDQRLGAKRKATAVLAPQLDMPDAAGTLGAQALGAGMDVRAVLPRRHGVEYHQPRVVDPTVGVFETPGDGWLQWARLAETQAPRCWQFLAHAQVVVKK